MESNPSMLWKLTLVFTVWGLRCCNPPPIWLLWIHGQYYTVTWIGGRTTTPFAPLSRRCHLLKRFPAYCTDDWVAGYFYLLARYVISPRVIWTVCNWNLRYARFWFESGRCIFGGTETHAQGAAINKSPTPTQPLRALRLPIRTWGVWILVMNIGKPCLYILSSPSHFRWSF